MPNIDTSESLFVEQMAARRASSRKGENGRVLVVGGSRVYHGAPFHAAKGAQAAGVDLVYVAVPNLVVSSIRSMSADLIVFPLPDSKLTLGGVRRLLKWLPDVDAAVVGPGMEGARTDALTYLLRELARSGVQLVLDAGAIQPGVPEGGVEKALFTPHGGEFKRLTGVSLPQRLEERAEIVSREARRLNSVILQKGHGDVITDGEVTYLNRTGRAAMTVGGTGDVLAGLTAGLCALRVKPLYAAAMAAYANGVAGTDAWSEFGNRLAASDLYDRLRRFLKKFDKEDVE